MSVITRSRRLARTFTSTFLCIRLNNRGPVSAVYSWWNLRICFLLINKNVLEYLLVGFREPERFLFVPTGLWEKSEDGRGTVTCLKCKRWRSFDSEPFPFSLCSSPCRHSLHPRWFRPRREPVRVRFLQATGLRPQRSLWNRRANPDRTSSVFGRPVKGRDLPPTADRFWVFGSFMCSRALLWSLSDPIHSTRE